MSPVKRINMKYQDKEVQICDQTWSIKFVQSIKGKDGKPKKGIRNFSTQTIYISLTDSKGINLTEQELKDALAYIVVPIAVRLRETYKERTGNDTSILDAQAKQKVEQMGLDTKPLQEKIIKNLKEDGILGS